MRRTCTVVVLVALLLTPGGAAWAADQEPAPIQASHQETESIGTAGAGRIGEITTLCITPDGRLLACDAKANEVKVFDASGKLLGAWPLPWAPYGICAAADGKVYVGGVARLAELDGNGKVLNTADVAEPLTTSSGGSGPLLARPGRDGGRTIGKASGMAVMGNELFVSFGSGWSLRAKAVIVRFARDLSGAVKIAEGLNGCCQRLDLTATPAENVLYVAENARYRVLKMDREGKVLASWGQRGRNEVEAFGSCCNPMNLCFGPGGALYTAESGLGRVKRYSPDGKLLGLVGEVGVTRFDRAGGLAASCSNIAVAVTADGSRVFVQDVKTNGIRVLAARK